MKNVLFILVSFFSEIIMAQEITTPLKEAFQIAREKRNIDIVLPVFLKSELYVVTAEVEPGRFDFFYTKSKQPERFCVTVAESEEAMSNIKWPKRKITGRQLIEELPDTIEIIITYKDGGDYISQEHLQWYRQQLP